jgi:hypothetical protein
MHNNHKKLEKKLKKIVKMLPEAQFETDNDGQIIIYTNIAKTDHGLFEMEDVDFDLREWVKDQLAAHPNTP